MYKPKRYIRLKELGVNIEKIYTPSNEYLSTRPNLDPKEVFFVKTDSNGNQVTIYNNNSLGKIYLLGASSIEALYIRQSLKPHSILERLLLENGYDYSVKNLGVSGTQMLNIINLLINKLGNAPGSIVVITLPSNDLGPLKYKDGYYSSHRYHASIMPSKSVTVEKNSILDLELYRRNLQFIKAVCELLKLKLVFTSVIYTGKDNNLLAFNQVARDYCKENSLIFLDLEEPLISSRHFFYDKVHLLSEGAMFFSYELYNKLIPLLKKGDNKKIRTIFFDFENEKLDENIKWSKNISTDNVEKIILTVNFEQLGPDNRSALYSVDYDCLPNKTNLIKSSNSNVGYFNYIRGVSNSKLERSFNIYIPSNCKNLKIGLRSWGWQSIYVYEAFISVIYKNNIEK